MEGYDGVLEGAEEEVGLGERRGGGLMTSCCVCGGQPSPGAIGDGGRKGEVRQKRT